MMLFYCIFRNFIHIEMGHSKNFSSQSSWNDGSTFCLRLSHNQIYRNNFIFCKSFRVYHINYDMSDTFFSDGFDINSQDLFHFCNACDKDFHTSYSSITIIFTVNRKSLHWNELIIQFHVNLFAVKISTLSSYLFENLQSTFSRLFAKFEKCAHLLLRVPWVLFSDAMVTYHQSLANQIAS